MAIIYFLSLTYGHKKTWDFFLIVSWGLRLPNMPNKKSPRRWFVSVFYLSYWHTLWNCRSFMKPSISKNAILCRKNLLSLNYNYSLSPFFPPFLRLKTLFGGKNIIIIYYSKIFFGSYLVLFGFGFQNKVSRGKNLYFEEISFCEKK